MSQIGSPLTPADLAMFKGIGVPSHLLESAGVRRVSHLEARDLCGIRYKSDHLEGIAIPYRDPDDDRVRTYRVRRDNPEVETDGTPIAKYVSPPDRKHPYFSASCSQHLTDTTTPVILVESPKSVLAIDAARLRVNRSPWPLLIATDGCWGWRCTVGKTTSADGTRVDEKGPLPDFDRVTWTGRDVVIAFDANAATNDKVKAARRALAAELGRRGAKIRILEIPVEPGINGPDDYIGKHGDRAFWALVDGAKAFTEKTTKPKPEKPKQGRDVQFDDIDPWPDVVDGAALLNSMAATFTRYLALPSHASAALALWVLHAFTFDAWFASPFLAVTSPAKRCGKTLLLIVLGAMVPRRLFASNVTPAVLFRTIEKYKPTLLIDEADTFVRDNEELRGVLNSGHTRTTAVVIRAVGDDHDPRAFSTWCPKAIALIGKLPGTLDDRAIEIRMRRRTHHEQVARLRQDRIDGECQTLRRQAARWADDHLDRLLDADPDAPAALHDRAADCWRPLLAIADVAGGGWPALAREAAVALSGIDADTDAATLLLGDIKGIFADEDDPDVLGSTVIIEKLVAMEDRPWSEWSQGRPMSPAKLARLLAGYGIHSAGVVRIGNKTPRAYRRVAFEDAWIRYGASEVQQRNNPNESGPESAISKCNTDSECCTLQSATNPMITDESCAVALREGEEGTDERF